MYIKLLTFNKIHNPPNKITCLQYTQLQIGHLTRKHTHIHIKNIYSLYASYTYFRNFNQIIRQRNERQKPMRLIFLNLFYLN